MIKSLIRKFSSIKLNYFSGSVATIAFMLFWLLLTGIREFLFPSKLIYPSASVFPRTTSGIDWRHNFFEPFFTYVVAIELHSILLWTIFIIVPLVSLVFISMLIKNMVTKRKSEIGIALINLFTLLATGIALSAFMFNILFPYLRGVKHIQNAKFVRLTDFSFKSQNQRSFVSKLYLESSLDKEIDVWGGIEYCFLDGNKQLFCLVDHPQARQPSFHYSINPGKNYYESVLTFDEKQYQSMINAKNLYVSSTFIGQDESLVKYERTIELPN